MTTKLNNKILPFNISLYIPGGNMLAGLKPVTTMEIRDQSGINYHPNGLYSVEIFGSVGSEDRDKRFSYIDLRVKILHPTIFFTLKSIKSLYAGIISGTKTAIWDPKISDFVSDTSDKASTGYSFFIKHFQDIKFSRNDSDIRSNRIDLVEKYRANCMFSKHLVMPAGLRDIEETEGTNASEHEINDIYRSIISTTNTIVSVDENTNSPAFDAARWSLQQKANDIYVLIMEQWLSGKKGYLQGKWAARTVKHGGRNVLTSMSTSVSDLDDPDATNVTDTHIGFLQALRGTLPKVIYHLKTRLSDIFDPSLKHASLINPKTLALEDVELSTEALDLFTTNSGLERLINRFYNNKLRNLPVKADGYYIALLYKDDKQFKLFRDIDRLPEGFSRDNVTPLTLSALLYIATYAEFKRLAGTVTRFPITGDESIYPTMYKLLTTTGSQSLYELTDDWELDSSNDDLRAPAFPVLDSAASWFESTAVHPSRLAGLGADHDGDMVSVPIVLTEDSINEIMDYYKRRSAYVSADGKLKLSGNIALINRITHNMFT